MALQKTYNFNGIEISDAYHVVAFVKYNKLGNLVSFRLDSFINEAKRNENNKESFKTEGYEFSPSGSYTVVGSDISSACYSYLKTLPGWSESVDV